MEAHAIFITDGVKEQRRREDLLAEGMKLWRNHAAEYRMTPYRYSFLVKEKRKAGLLIKSPLSKRKLEDYPDVPFFRILDEAEAHGYLDRMSTEILERRVEHYSFVVTSDYTYVTMKEWVTDATYILAHQKRKATLFY